MIDVYIDAGTKGNLPAMLAIKVDSLDVDIYELDIDYTNNELEYLALLKFLNDYDYEECLIHCDSKLVVEQVNGNWQCKEPRLRELLDKVKLGNHKLIWIPRGNNPAGKVIEKRQSSLKYYYKFNT